MSFLLYSSHLSKKFTQLCKACHVHSISPRQSSKINDLLKNACNLESTLTEETFTEFNFRG